MSARWHEDRRSNGSGPRFVKVVDAQAFVLHRACTRQTVLTVWRPDRMSDPTGPGVQVCEYHSDPDQHATPFGMKGWAKSLVALAVAMAGDGFVCWGRQGGSCGHVHLTLRQASHCLAEAIHETRTSDSASVRDRRVWRLVAGQRRPLTVAETDASYAVWSSACVGNPARRGSRHTAA